MGFLELEQEESGGIVLKVSDTLLRDDCNPSVHQATFYLLDRLQCKGACGIDFTLAQSRCGKKRKREDDGDKVAKRRKRNDAKGMRITRGVRKKRREAGRLSWMPSDAGWELDGYEIHRLTRTTIAPEGPGGACFKGDIEGVPVVLKMCDLFNNGWGAEMMEREVQIYEQLKPLQGEIIPEFYHYEEYGIVGIMIISYIEGVEYDMKYDPRGTIIEKASAQLMKVHDLGISHRDLEKRNILVRYTPPQVWFIDFGFSRPLKGDKDRQEDLDFMEYNLKEIE